jgi:hypothetical protein
MQMQQVSYIKEILTEADTLRAPVRAHTSLQEGARKDNDHFMEV